MLKLLSDLAARISQLLIQKKRSRVRRIFSTTLACMIVFVTTYSLILPAITLEDSEAERMPGVSLAEMPDTTLGALPAEELDTDDAYTSWGDTDVVADDSYDDGFIMADTDEEVYFEDGWDEAGDTWVEDGWVETDTWTETGDDVWVENDTENDGDTWVEDDTWTEPDGDIRGDNDIENNNRTEPEDAAWTETETDAQGINDAENNSPAVTEGSEASGDLTGGDKDTWIDTDEIIPEDNESEDLIYHLEYIPSMGTPLEGVTLSVDFPGGISPEARLSLEEILEGYETYRDSAIYEIGLKYPELGADRSLCAAHFFKTDLVNVTTGELIGGELATAAFEFDPALYDAERHAPARLLIAEWEDEAWMIYDEFDEFEELDVIVETLEDGGICRVTFDTDALGDGHAEWGVILLENAIEGDVEPEPESDVESFADFMEEKLPEAEFIESETESVEAAVEDAETEFIPEEIDETDSMPEEMAEVTESVYEYAEGAESVAEEVVEPEGFTVESVAEEIVEPVEFTVESVVEEIAEPAVSTVESVVEEIAEPVESTVESVVEEIAESAESGVDSVVEEVAEPVESTVESVVEEIAEPAESTVESVVEEIAEPTESTAESMVEEVAEPPAAPVGVAGSRTVEVPGADLVLHVSYDADAGIPENAEFVAVPVESETYAERALSLVNSTVDEDGEDHTEQLDLVGLFDLTVYADGKVIAPQAQIRVSVGFAEAISENEEIYAVHFPGTGEQPETVDASADVTETYAEGYGGEAVAADVAEMSDGVAAVVADASDEVSAETGTADVPAFEKAVDDYFEGAAPVVEEMPAVKKTMKFAAPRRVAPVTEMSEPVDETTAAAIESAEAASETASSEIAAEVVRAEVSGAGAEFVVDGLSYIAVVRYTVDFHWEVNGKTFEFSIPGGGFVSLEHLVELLSIAMDSKNLANGAEAADSRTENQNPLAEEIIIDSDGKNEAVGGKETAEEAAEVEENTAEAEESVNAGSAIYEQAVSLNLTDVSEATKKFVAEVEGAEFSNPDLVWIKKVDIENTIGGLKEVYGLEIEYSADLTEEQIAEINTQTVNAGDWALISLHPFTSEETLTVTMKNGHQFVVKVTDAQMRKTVIDARGDTWEITVTYDDSAQIPEGAELRVREILPEEEEYQNYYEQSLKTVGVVLKQDSNIPETEDGSETESETEDGSETESEAESESETESEVENGSEAESAAESKSEMGLEQDDKALAIPVDNYARIFDIEIWAGNNKIEPRSNVIVDVRLLDAPDKSELLPHVVHFGEYGTELMELTEKSESNEYDVQFETNEFSVYSVIYTVDLHYDAETGTLLYEDNKIKVTVTAKEKVKDVFPEEAILIVKEMIPEDEEAADLYAQALTALSDSLREQNYGFSAVKVYDFSILDKKGNEIEPNGKVSVKIEYKEKPELSDNDQSGADIQIAHLVEDPTDEERPTIEFVDAKVDATTLGTISGAEFTTDSFSAYLVFNRDGITNQEPTALGNYGWLRFHTVGERDTTPNQTADADSTTILWGYYKNDGSNLPSLNMPQAYRRILKVRLWLPKSGQDPAVYDSDHYNEAATVQYFWVWQNEVNIEEFELPGYEVVHTRMHTAWDEENGKEPVESDSLVGSYNVRGYRRSTLSDEPGAKNSDLNILDIYAKPLPQVTGMKYIIRYVHADGSVTDGNVRSLASGSVTYDASQYKREGEVYAGTSIVTGSDAINANLTAGTGTITYKPDVPLAKVYVYYKDAHVGNGNPDTKGRYDKDENGYYTGAKGLYTDKSAETVSGKDRQFILNLESWYIDNAASVGMVLDASGSMAWTSGEPEPIVLTDEQVAEVRRANGMWQDNWGNWHGDNDIFFNGGSNNAAGNPPNSGQYITNFGALSLILDKTRTDNSAMGYNGYHYYLKDMRSSVREYVALGYSDGNQSGSESLGGKTIYTTQVGNTSYTGTVLANRFISGQNNAHGQNEGWYYVNSTGNTKAYYKYTGKSYDGYSSKGWWPSSNDRQMNLAGGPLRFYVKTGTNELWVSYYNSSDNEIRQSPVYEKREKMFTKMETLQDAVSQFGAIVLGSSPDSQIGITRFSQQVGETTSDKQPFTNTSYLPLLNWSSSTEELSAAMNLSKSSKGSTSKNDDELTVYEYGLTGQTRTWTGVKAYSDYLKNSATATNHKYLIIFTDGKDTNGDADSSTWGRTGTEIQQLKTAGYTIITVMMRSQAMTGNDYTSAKAFLQGIASPGLDGNALNTSADNKLYFEADSNSTKDVIDAFRQIANKIASGLNGYVIRDYIDPRFDVLNDAGDVLTVLDSNGQFTNATNPDVDAATGLRGFTTPDNKHAYLGYDPAKKMFYVLWKDQEIPASTIDSRNVNPWKSQIRIQAKEDFLGGNDILSNGNETGMNQVYYPNSTDPSGMTPVTGNTEYPSKDFPKTTTNPGTLNITLSNYEDTIFLGETISPAGLYESVQAKRDSATDYRSLYFNYLVRAGQKFQNDPDYYVNLLKYGTVPVGASNANPAKDRNGNDISDFVFTSDANGVTALTLPYYYLENSGDASSYAGGTLHQGDEVGKVTYSWKATETGEHALTNNNALLDYESTTLDTVRYQLSVTYVPDEAKYDSLDVNGNVVGDSSNLTDNGSARTLKLAGQYGTDKLIKDPVGGPAQTQTTITDPESMGLAAIHVVAGKLKITKRIEVTEEKWTKLIGQVEDAGLTFTFQLKRNDRNYGSPISLTMKSDNSTRTGNYVELSSDWIANLPLGNYTIEETDMPTGYGFVSVSADAVIDTDGDGGVSGTQFAAPTEGSVTWKIGQVSGGTPVTATYSDTDFTAEKVKDTNKEVDPDKSKAYLNAQIGKGIILNEPPKTIDVTLKKVDIEDLSNNDAVLLKGAKFTITKYTDSHFNVVDTDSPWSCTLDDEKMGNTYSLNGKFEFKDLPIGFFKIDEARMPDGYVSFTDDPVFEVRVKVGTSDLEVVSYKKNGDSYEAVNSGATEITRVATSDTLVVGNTPGAALPNTGGPGTNLLYLLGLMLTGLAGAGLIMRKKRRAVA